MEEAEAEEDDARIDCFCRMLDDGKKTSYSFELPVSEDEEEGTEEEAAGRKTRQLLSLFE